MKKTYLLIGLLVLSIFIVAGCNSENNSVQQTTQENEGIQQKDNNSDNTITEQQTEIIQQEKKTKEPILSTGDIKSLAKTIPYKELFRNSEKYEGEYITFKGKIIQVIPYDEGIYDFRINTDSENYFLSDTILISEYSGDRILEGDMVNVWANYDGIYQYESIFGGVVEVPTVINPIIELIE